MISLTYATGEDINQARKSFTGILENLIEQYNRDKTDIVFKEDYLSFVTPVELIDWVNSLPGYALNTMTKIITSLCNDIFNVFVDKSSTTSSTVERLERNVERLRKSVIDLREFLDSENYNEEIKKILEVPVYRKINQDQRESARSYLIAAHNFIRDIFEKRDTESEFSYLFDKEKLDFFYQILLKDESPITILKNLAEISENLEKYRDNTDMIFNQETDSKLFDENYIIFKEKALDIYENKIVPLF